MLGYLRMVFMGGVLLSMIGCSNPQPGAQDYELKQGIWRGVINLNDSTELPFNFEVIREGEAYGMVFHNADERLKASEVKDLGDSLLIQMPVFATYLKLQKGSDYITGVFSNPDAENYHLPFSAVYGDSLRFHTVNDKCCDINRKWRVALSPGTDDEDPAIAYFDQNGSRIKATFLTKYGDWRYLEGVLDGDLLRLSAFNGGSLYYLEGKVLDGQKIEG